LRIAVGLVALISLLRNETEDGSSLVSHTSIIALHAHKANVFVLIGW